MLKRMEKTQLPIHNETDTQRVTVPACTLAQQAHAGDRCRRFRPGFRHEAHGVTEPAQAKRNLQILPGADVEAAAADLELDARLLVEEYKQRFERPAGMDVTPLNLRRQRHKRRVAPRIGPGIVVVLGIVALLGALYLLGVSGNNGDEQEPPAAVETA